MANSAVQTFIDRPTYMHQLMAWRDKSDVIKVITGIRRCGKSTIFYLYQMELQMKYGVLDNQIQQINFEDANFSDLLDWKKLHDHILAKTVPNKMNYIFLDEIQNVEHFEKAINSLRLRDNIDIYITGSNSKMLSGELATMLSGRYITIHMQPLSFEEYVTAYNVHQVGMWTARSREGVLNPRRYNLESMFQDYLHNSGFPYTVQLLKFAAGGTPADAPIASEQVRQFLSSLLDTIVLKDIVERKNIKDVSRLKKVISFMFDNIGRETSLLGIKKSLEADSGIKIDFATVDGYVESLLDTFVMYRADRYDIKGKQLLKTNSKYYVADIGLRYMLLGREGDAGHILENIVYLELIRRGYQVYVGKVGTNEVDFVAIKNGTKEYYQVSQQIGNSETRERELRSLDSIDDHNPKFLITMDRSFAEEYKGIKIINAFDWLLPQE